MPSQGMQSQGMQKQGIENRLRQVAGDLSAAREELRVLDEQIAHFADGAEEARLRALVSETPLAQKEHREASRTVEALQKDRASWQERLARLEQQQDELLDRLSDAT